MLVTEYGLGMHDSSLSLWPFYNTFFHTHICTIPSGTVYCRSMKFLPNVLLSFVEILTYFYTPNRKSMESYQEFSFQKHKKWYFRKKIIKDMFTSKSLYVCMYVCMYVLFHNSTFCGCLENCI